MDMEYLCACCGCEVAEESLEVATSRQVQYLEVAPYAELCEDCFDWAIELENTERMIELDIDNY